MHFKGHSCVFEAIVVSEAVVASPGPELHLLGQSCVSWARVASPGPELRLQGQNCISEARIAF